MVKHYEAYLSERFFQGQQVSLIPRIGQPMHIKIADAAETAAFPVGGWTLGSVLLTYPYMLEPTATTSCCSLREPSSTSIRGFGGPH